MQLLDLGLTPEQAAGYLLAEETHGCMRPNAPQWIMRSTMYRILAGEAPSLVRLDDLTRSSKALHDLEDIRDAAWAAEG
jgi:hypothetical protein